MIFNIHILENIIFIYNKLWNTLAVKICGYRGKSAGAYTGSHGIDMIRKHAAAYIKNRDGVDSDFNNICLSSGASAAIKYVMELFCNNPCKKSGTTLVCDFFYRIPVYSAGFSYSAGCGIHGHRS